MFLVISEVEFKKQYKEITEVTIQHRLKITPDKKSSYVTDAVTARMLPNGTLIPEVRVEGLFPNTEYVFKIISNVDKKNFVKETHTTPEE